MGKYNKNKLSLIYHKGRKDFIIKYPRNCDGSLVCNHLIHDILRYVIPTNRVQYPYNFEIFNFKEELEKRGYDLNTLKFSIELKKD